MVPTLLRQRMPRAATGLLCAAVLMAPARAQPAPTAARPDPLDAQAAVPALRYQSATAQYRRLGDEKTVPWRDANDAVARIGGWRVYAREAQQADPPAPATVPATVPAPAPASAKPPGDKPAGHAGHQQP